ncbi:hypothetical protein D3C76_1359840 [compost metagenome]
MAEGLFEAFGEREEIRVPHQLGDLRQLVVGFHQQPPGFIHLQALDVFPRGEAETGGKPFAEMGALNAHIIRYLAGGDPLGIMNLHILGGTLEPGFGAVGGPRGIGAAGQQPEEPVKHGQPEQIGVLP